MTKTIVRDLPKTTPSFMTLSILVTALFLSGCKSEIPQDEPLPVVRPVLTEIAQPALDSQRFFNGVVQATDRAKLSFRTSGRLIEILVNEGSKVEKGQLIARLDSTDETLTLSSAQVELQNSRTEYLRGKSLYENRQAISKSQFDELSMRYNLAKNRLKEAESRLSDTNLRAPFDGIISRRLVDNHMMVQANETIVAIHDLSKMEVLIDVPQAQMIQGNRSQQLRAYIPAYGNKAFDLSLKTYETEPDPVTRTFGVTLTFDDLQNTTILPGMNVRVMAYSTLGDDAPISAPITAVTPDNLGKQYVWVVNKDNHLEQRYVATGALNGDRIQILSDVNVGEVLVVSGVRSLTEGIEVRPTLAEANR